MNAGAGFDLALAFVLRHEGGYSRDPRDPGGETKYGISRRSYPDLDIAALSPDEAGRIYRRDFWERLSLDGLPPALAAATLDAAVNLGPVPAVKMLQQGLNRTAGCGLLKDGLPGPLTMAAARALSGLALRLAVKEVLLLRAAHYARLAGSDPLRAFLRGWILRTTELSDYLDEVFFTTEAGYR